MRLGSRRISLFGRRQAVLEGVPRFLARWCAAEAHCVQKPCPLAAAFCLTVQFRLNRGIWLIIIYLTYIRNCWMDDPILKI